MYSFTNTTPGTTTYTLPVEAMSLNGSYIENVLTGYQTLYVTGRELLSPEVASDTVGKRAGSVYLYKRYPARVLTIGYQLTADTPANFRARFNTLSELLDVENATIIFNDESDKFFIGTPSGVSTPPAGALSITSEFTILCTDPFKYSVTEYTATAVGGTFTVNYNGTVPAYPILTADFTDENGFVAWVSDDASAIQIGDVNEEDTASYDDSQTLINATLTALTGWTQSAGASGANVTTTGSMSILTDAKSQKLAGANTIGTGTKWHGPRMTLTLPADSNGHVGASEFRYRWKQRYAMTSGVTAQYGFSEILLVYNDGNDRTIVAGVGFYKNQGSNYYVRSFYINRADGGTPTKTYKDFNATYNNVPTGFAQTTPPSNEIKKIGDTVTFTINNSKYSFTDPTIENMEVNEITWACGGLASVTRIPSTQIGLMRHKFIKDFCNTFVDIPNKFTAGDHVEIDTGSGQITLNDSLMPEYGAIGNEYEGFVLEKGANSIAVAYSSWANAPTFKLKYRERFL